MIHWFCSNCGRKWERSETHCPACRWKVGDPDLTPLRYCLGCGKQHTSEGLHCAACFGRASFKLRELSSKRPRLVTTLYVFGALALIVGAIGGSVISFVPLRSEFGLAGAILMPLVIGSQMLYAAWLLLGEASNTWAHRIFVGLSDERLFDLLAIGRIVAPAYAAREDTPPDE